MGTVDASPDALARLAADVSATDPIVLVNLLRFHDTVTVDGVERAGRDLFATYSRALEPVIMSVGGRPIWRGDAAMTLIGPSHERWDEIILVSYPSRRAFEELVRSPTFEEHAYLRSAALEDSRLIVATGGRIIGRAAWRLYSIASKVRRRS